MDNQWIETGPVFGLEDSDHRFRPQGVRRKSVYGFGRKSYNLPRTQQLNRAFGSGARRHNLGFHGGNFAASTLSLCFFLKAPKFCRILSSDKARIAAASNAA